MIVEQAEPSGEGRAKAALKELMNKLAGEGLFDDSRKTPLPRFPRRIAVVTSPNGAAVQDIIVTIRERFMPVDILVVPVPVQGTEAPREISKALYIVDSKALVDVIIVGRGGGSEEDLAAFNDEKLVRAVAACKTPIVSAVGHEIDVTLTDLAADARAITPTAAGKMVVPDTQEILGLLASRAEMMGMIIEQRVAEASASVEDCAEGLKRYSPRRKIDDLSQKTDMAAGRMDRALRHRLSLAVGRLSGVAERLRGRSPAAALRDRKTRMDYLGRALAQGVKTRLRVAKLDLDKETATLNALSPLAVLGRGYTITMGPDGKPLRSVDGVNRGENIETKVRDGTIRSKVEEKRERKEDGV
jgi:exodeoxyribonuclease VII large subunit